MLWRSDRLMTNYSVFIAWICGTMTQAAPVHTGGAPDTALHAAVRRVRGAREGDRGGAAGGPAALRHPGPGAAGAAGSEEGGELVVAPAGQEWKREEHGGEREG